jgi:hypothetical protein
MRVYTGSAWTDTTSSVSILRWTKTASGGETSLSGNDNNSVGLAYTVNFEQLYLNGVLLVRGVDYVATNGSTITGLEALVSGDIVEIIALSEFSLANAYTKPEADAIFPNMTTMPISGFRNAIINGDFRVNQRVFSSVTTNDTYGHDRWKLGVGGNGTATYSPVAFAVGNAISGHEPINHARIVTTGQTTSAVNSILVQPIEDVRTFANQSIVISFWAKANSGTPKIAIELDQQFGTGGSARVTTYVNQVTLSTSWARYTATITVPSVSGKTIGANSFISLFLWVSAGTDFNARTNSLGIQTNTFDIWGVQVEKGTIATPFEQRPIATETSLCQRYYYEISGQGGDDALCQGHYYGAQQLWCVIQHPVLMRRGPSFSLPSGSYTGYAVGVGNAIASAVQYSGTTQNSTVYFNTVNARTLGVGGWVASAAGKIQFSSEF